MTHKTVALKVDFKPFLADEKGGLPSVEFALISIPAILLAMCVVQYMLFAQSVIVMRSAAHAAARSALVHYCPPTKLSGALGNVAQYLMNSCTPDHTEVLNATRIALIPISPSSTKSKSRQGSCSFPDALPAIMEGSMRNSSNMKQAFENKACYAFEPNNVKVEITWEGLLGGISLDKKMPPLTAKITFRLPVLAPVRMIFSNGSRSDGTRYYEKSMEINFL